MTADYGHNDLQQPKTDIGLRDPEMARFGGQQASNTSYFLRLPQ